MKSKHKLLRAIQRSELAYSYYIEDKIYFQAARIYKANKIVYTLLEEYLYECSEDEIVLVCTYLFHLEDWFNHFESELSDIKLNDKFVFDRLDGEIPFPKEFKKILT